MSVNAIHSAQDARRVAKRRLPWMVFDYIDGAAGRETGAARNRAALDAITLRPRILRDVSSRDLSVPLFGAQAARPFGIAPMGMCNLSGPGADLMLARLAAKYTVPHGVSTVASTPLEKIIEVADGNAWFQLYFSGDGVGTFKLVERAKAAGYTTLVVTVDVPEVGRCWTWTMPCASRRQALMPSKSPATVRGNSKARQHRLRYSRRSAPPWGQNIRYFLIAACDLEKTSCGRCNRAQILCFWAASCNLPSRPGARQACIGFGIF